MVLTLDIMKCKYKLLKCSVVLTYYAAKWGHKQEIIKIECGYKGVRLKKI